MSVFRVHHKSEYTVICNRVIRDNNLSLKSLGLFVKMLSLPPDWDFCIKGLAAICKDGEFAINSCLQELEDLHYLKRTRIYEDGKIVDIEYDIYECPYKENDVEQKNLDQENLDLGFQDNKIKNKLNKDTNKNKELEELSDEEFYEKFKNKKDIRTLIKWTYIKIQDKTTVELIVQWLKLMLANNKWQTLETFNSKIDNLFESKGDLDVNDVIKDTIEKGYFSFSYSVNSLLKNRKNLVDKKPAFYYNKDVNKSNDSEIGYGRKVDLDLTEVF